MYSRVFPPPSTDSATLNVFVMRSKAFTNSGCWWRKRPVRVIRPGPNAFTVTLLPLDVNLRSSSYEKSMLHSLLSL